MRVGERVETLAYFKLAFVEIKVTLRTCAIESLFGLAQDV